MLMPFSGSEPGGRHQSAEGSNCLFDQPWWLDAVAPDQWSAIEIRRGDQLTARWPFTIKRRYGMTLLGMPDVTPVLGPWIAPSEGKYVTRLTREKDALTELLDELPRFDFFSQRMHPSMQNWLPFHWRNWQQTTRYTYVLDDLTDLDRVWTGLRENIRREIRKARKRLQIVLQDEIGPVTELVSLTYGRQDRSLPVPTDTLRRIGEACRGRGSGRAFVAIDDQGRRHAAVFLVWDHRCAYYLLGGADPQLRNSGAHSLAMWQAIQFAATVSREFDFEGSMREPIERFFRSFGARQTPYLKLTRCNSKLMQTALAFRDVLRK